MHKYVFGKKRPEVREETSLHPEKGQGPGLINVLSQLQAEASAVTDFSTDGSADESPDGEVPAARRTRRSDAVLAFTAPSYAQLERHLRRRTQLLGRYRHAKRARGDG